MTDDFFFNFVSKMIKSTPFLTPFSEKCPLCNCSLTESDKKAVQEAGFITIRKNAELWSQLDGRVCADAPYRSFRDVSTRLQDDVFDAPFYVHKSCSITCRRGYK